jgi:sporulation protein YlmC with PRC-barrel domain
LFFRKEKTNEQSHFFSLILTNFKVKNVAETLKELKHILFLGDRMAETKVRAADIVGKTIISEETGRKFGVVSNIDFITESGELMNLVVEQPTRHLSDLNMKSDEKGRLLVPFSSVKSIGDFVIVSENELI